MTFAIFSTGSVRKWIARCPLIVACLPAISSAANLLLIPSNGPTQYLSPQTAVAGALQTAGHQVTVAPLNELSWDGTNPAPAGFDAVLHFGYEEFSTPPAAAQAALVSYVAGGGNYFALGSVAVRAARRPASSALQPLMALKIPTNTAYPIGSGSIQLRSDYGHPAWTGLATPIQGSQNCIAWGGSADSGYPWMYTTDSTSRIVPVFAVAELGAARLAALSFEMTCLDSAALRGVVVRTVDWLVRNTNGVTANDQVLHVNE